MMNPGSEDQFIDDVAKKLGPAAIEVPELMRFFEESKSWDADAEAKSLSTPTLLIHQRNSKAFSIDKTRRVAALITNSRVAFVDSVFEGAALAQRFFEGDVPDLTERPPKSASPPPDAEAMRTILFTDVEGSVAHTERLGDAPARELLR